MDLLTRLYLIRHGEVEKAYHKVFGGRIDMELSPLGHEQVRAIARFLRDAPPDVMYASPMRRVQQTLAPLAEETGLKPILLDGLREVDFGAWTGLSWDEVLQKHGVSAFSWLHQLEDGTIELQVCGKRRGLIGRHAGHTPVGPDACRPSCELEGSQKITHRALAFRGVPRPGSPLDRARCIVPACRRGVPCRNHPDAISSAR
jgi:hypothetical protein